MVAHRTGAPFGNLALAVTVIETARIARLGVPKEVLGTVVAALVLLLEALW